MELCSGGLGVAASTQCHVAGPTPCLASRTPYSVSCTSYSLHPAPYTLHWMHRLASPHAAVPCGYSDTRGYMLQCCADPGGLGSHALLRCRQGRRLRCFTPAGACHECHIPAVHELPHACNSPGLRCLAVAVVCRDRRGVGAVQQRHGILCAMNAAMRVQICDGVVCQRSTRRAARHFWIMTQLARAPCSHPCI